MSWKNINLETKRSKKRFLQKKQQQQQTFNIGDIDANKLLVSKEEPYGINGSIKYFIGYSDNDVIRPISIILSQMIAYAKYFESNKIMSFKISDNKLLKKYTQIWKTVRILLNIKFDSEMFVVIMIDA